MPESAGMELAPSTELPEVYIPQQKQRQLGGAGDDVSKQSSDGGDNRQHSIDDELRERIEHAKHDHHTLMQDYGSGQKLGVFSTGCLLINRMIGTGIFETPKTVWMGTRSVSGALFMWCLGSLIAFSGLFVYLELGLTIPRYVVRGEWRSVPRSGGEKNYVGYSSYSDLRNQTALFLFLFLVVKILMGGDVFFIS